MREFSRNQRRICATNAPARFVCVRIAPQCANLRSLLTAGSELSELRAELRALEC